MATTEQLQQAIRKEMERWHAHLVSPSPRKRDRMVTEGAILAGLMDAIEASNDPAGFAERILAESRARR